MKPLLFILALTLGLLQTAPGGNGSVSGIVIQSGTDRPIDNVQIVITPVTAIGGPPQREQLAAISDQLGRFEITDLVPGRYRMQWRRPGFSTPPVGTERPGESISQSLRAQLGVDSVLFATPPAATSVTVDLSPQEKLSGLVFALIPGGVISGRVLDPTGKPLVNATLTGLWLTYEDGRRTLRPGGGSTTTDDRGEFRLYGLRPGEYYLRVEYRLAAAASNELVRAYYPGVNLVSAAVPIVVNESGESPGANFGIPGSGTSKVSGTVVGIDNVVRAGVSFYLVPAGNSELTDPGTLSFANSATSPEDRAAGRFELRGVPSGQYNLLAELFDNAVMQSYSAAATVNVGSQDVENVLIAIRPLNELNGRVVLEDGSSIRRPLELRTRSVEATLGQGASPLINSSADGAFTIRNLHNARYSVIERTETANGTCVVDLRQDGKSAYDDGFISTGGPIDVVLSNQCGTIQVQIVDDKQKPVASAFVSLVPAMEHRRNPLLYRRAMFDVAASRYLPIDLIPPGEYKMFALDNIPPNAELNAEFLAKFEDRGVPVTVKHGASITVQLPLISTKN